MILKYFEIGIAMPGPCFCTKFTEQLKEVQ